MLARSLRRAAAAATFAGIAAVPGAARAQDYSYAFRVLSDEGEPLVGTVRVSGALARIDVKGKGDGDEPRDYLLGSRGGDEVAVVNPRERSYSVAAGGSFERIVGTAIRAVKLGVQMQLSDVRISTDRLGAGDTIAGLPTQRYRLTQEYAATVGVMGMKGDPEYHVVITDFWVPRAPKLMRNPLVEMLATTETALAQGDSAFGARSNAARNKLFVGMPLRMIVGSRW
jgi:hypothetical protein